MILTFSSKDRRDQAQEARAAVTALNLWLKELPRPVQATPASVEFKYDGGQLVGIVVRLDE
ncbi:hypothetical protein [Pseudomonas sp. DP16D-R1]|uniref:hypothetical protein n=1 Tax=Pseudomonas sp. DP16D-R1 TaxID=2075551 RepID=UPI000CD2E12C|nr:hypothetical protein [Pseudomonas sp. DP16D-R1]POA78011.1 hypothetical protein C1890_12400 [Pseudomonas sp. DP16D-R1]